MPSLNRKRIIKDKVSASAQDGEITINLNLQVTIDGDSTIKVEAGAIQAPAGIPSNYNSPLGGSDKPEVEEKAKPLEIVPEELFSNDTDDNLMTNFGSDV